MVRVMILVLGLFSCSSIIFAQDQLHLQDSIQRIDSILITASRSKKIETDIKMAISVDEFLASSSAISFIKRGAFAWEPLLNNMSTERTNITLDGMHIFGACTDKMDPVTSYIETNNLSSIAIHSGQEGSIYGSTIGGNIDMQRRQVPFGLNKKWTGSYQTGFEFNNRQFFNLANLTFSSNRFVADGSISLREAANYTAGDKQEVQHSQFHKFNSSLALAYKTSELSSVRVDAIYDKAWDVGFPGLPMDLWLSRALITSVSYKQLFEERLVRAWDSKVYFNALEHYMDDTKRPDNLVHMDMPGWSTTYGLLSRIDLVNGNYTGEVVFNAYDNVSIAEMTMYPQDRSNKTMFAYTWPWVTTRYAGISTKHTIGLRGRQRINFGAGLGWNYNYSKYVEFNWIFYPGASQRKNRVLPSLTASYEWSKDNYFVSLGTGYGQRAPSISEGYGYYIFNSYDRYDYIGNPDLKNETSYEANLSMAWRKERVGLEAKANYFHIQNYIVGQILDLGSPMNYQSVGVKGYISLPYARIVNLSMSGNYDILPHLHWKGTLVYARAIDNHGENLPFIRPLSYQSSLHYMFRHFGIQSSIQGDFAQRHYSSPYGESGASAYHIWNASADYTFHIHTIKAVLQLGAENIMDTYYSTYADWGNIPRMGRNIFTALKVNF